MPSNNYYSIAVRVHQRERFACKRAAELAGMTVSAWSRKTLVGALHPTDFDAGDVYAEQPEDAAQEQDGGAEPCEPMGQAQGDEAETAERDGPQFPLVQQDAEDGGDGMLPAAPDANRQPKRGLDVRPGGHPNVQPLTFNKTDLCPRCQRMGPSCQKCRALVRGTRSA